MKYIFKTDEVLVFKIYKRLKHSSDEGEVLVRIAIVKNL